MLEDGIGLLLGQEVRQQDSHMDDMGQEHVERPNKLLFDSAPLHNEALGLDVSMKHWGTGLTKWMMFSRTIPPNLESLEDSIIWVWGGPGSAGSAPPSSMIVYQNILLFPSGLIRDMWLCKEVVRTQILLHGQNTRIVLVYIRSAKQ